MTRLLAYGPAAVGALVLLDREYQRWVCRRIIAERTRAQLHEHHRPAFPVSSPVRFVVHAKPLHAVTAMFDLACLLHDVTLPGDPVLPEADLEAMRVFPNGEVRVRFPDSQFAPALNPLGEGECYTFGPRPAGSSWSGAFRRASRYFQASEST